MDDNAGHPIFLPVLPAGSMPKRLADQDGYTADGVARDIIADIANTLPCFGSMKALTGDADVALDNMRLAMFSTGAGKDDLSSLHALGAHVRRLGAPLKGDAFGFFAMMADGDPASLPQVAVLLEADTTWLIVEQAAVNNGKDYMLLAWKGGRNHYAAHAQDRPLLKDMVDANAVALRKKEAEAAAIEAEKNKMSIAVTKAMSAAATSQATPQAPLGILRQAGFKSAGSDAGPLLVLERDLTWQVTGAGGEPLARSTAFALQTVDSAGNVCVKGLSLSPQDIIAMTRAAECESSPPPSFIR